MATNGVSLKAGGYMGYNRGAGSGGGIDSAARDSGARYNSRLESSPYAKPNFGNPRPLSSYQPGTREYKMRADYIETENRNIQTRLEREALRTSLYGNKMPPGGW